MMRMAIGITIAIVIAIAIIVIYKNQKKNDSLYDKVTKLIDNKNVKKMINTLTIFTVIVLTILLILLELSIVLPSFNWEVVDRNTLITSIATIIGGFFGFIGAAIGVIGTYGAFYLGVKKEQEKEIKLSYQLIYYILKNSLVKTEKLTKNIVDSYDGLEDSIKKQFLKGNIKSDIKYISEHFTAEYTFVSKWNSNLIPKGMVEKQWSSLYLFNIVNEKLINDIEHKKLIYNEECYKAIIDLPEDYMDNIMTWINNLKFNTFKDVYEFIETRDNIIAIVEEISNSKYIKSEDKNRCKEREVENKFNINKYKKNSNVNKSNINTYEGLYANKVIIRNNQESKGSKKEK